MKKRFITATAVFLAIVMVATLTYAATKAKKTGSKAKQEVQKELSIDDVRKKLQEDFPNTKAGEIRTSVFEGLYEVETGANIIYYSPKGYIMFGELMEKTGKNITAERRTEIAAKNLSKLPLDKALKIGNGPKKVVLFTDPDCPYCRKVDDYLKTVRNDVTLYVFLFPLSQIHPKAEAKSKWVLSAEDTTKAFDEAMSTKMDSVDVQTLKFANNAADRLAEHMTYAARVGVRGVPALWIGDRYVPGANMPLIESLIKQK
ncbi:MAG: hypothetical protein CSYNP_04009 [Syntrophus sp. SKADARSKE-3]|nr:hypothetical protein [Syntrophus sp. SKADARSKE-3]